MLITRATSFECSGADPCQGSRCAVGYVVSRTLPGGRRKRQTILWAFLEKVRESSAPGPPGARSASRGASSRPLRALRHLTTSSTPSPYRSSLAGPTPLIRSSAAGEVGRANQVPYQFTAGYAALAIMMFMLSYTKGAKEPAGAGHGH